MQKMSVKTTLLCFSYACSAQSEELTQRVKHSNKILLPPSVLHTINNENDFTSPTDDINGGDIINPMEAAQYYQGSFQDQTAFAQAALDEYRSQESEDDDDKLNSVNVEV